MRHPKSILINSAQYAIDKLGKNDFLDELAVTKLQLHDYHKNITNKLNHYPLDNLNDSMVFRLLTHSFKQLKDRRNMVTETYTKLYCKYFIHKLQKFHSNELGD